MPNSKTGGKKRGEAPFRSKSRLVKKGFTRGLVLPKAGKRRRAKDLRTRREKSGTSSAAPNPTEG